jgi:hypothetical protein
MRRNVAVLMAVLLVGALTAGATTVASTTGVPYPVGCWLHGLSSRRCALVVDAVERTHGVDPSAVREVRLLGDPGCGGDPGQMCVRTTSFAWRVRLALDDGRTVEEARFCSIDAMYDDLCTDTPQIRRSSPILDGYADIPCSGDPSGGCASPVPSIDPVTARRASPLSVPSLDIPIDHVGGYDVTVGEVAIPNGVLTSATFALANPAPGDLLVTPDGVSLDVVSLDGGGAFRNIYEHGWHAGVERAAVHLRFTVVEFDPGAVLRIRGIDVG